MEKTRPEPEINSKRFALLFPGQGSQRAGMAAHLLEISRAARAVFEEADRALDFSLSRLILEGNDAEMTDTENTQPALLATSIAHFEHLKERLHSLSWHAPAPTLFAGHSLGQFSAAVAADALSFEHGLQLVRERGRIMKEWAQSRPGGLVTIIGMAREAVREICERVSDDNESVDIAVHNAPSQFVISGDLGPLERALRLARDAGATALRLPISVPGHTPVMRDAADKMDQAMRGVSFRAPSSPLVSNISGELLTSAEEVRQELSDQICAAVEWVRCMSAMVNNGIATFVEVGPGRALSHIAERFEQSFRFLTLEDARDEELATIAIPIETQPV